MNKFLTSFSSFLVFSAFLTGQNNLLATEVDQNGENTEVQTTSEKAAEQLGKAKVATKHNLKKAANKVKEGAHKTAETAKEAKETTAEKMHDFKEAVVEKIDDIKEEAGDAVQTLKHKLQDLKDAEHQGEVKKQQEYNSQA